MSRDYTTDGLIDSIIVRSGIPILQELFAASELLLLADQIMIGKLVPLILEHRKGHFLTYTDVVTTGSNRIDIPEDAMDSGLKNVTFIDTNGLELPGVPVDFDAEIERNVIGQNIGIDPRSYRRYYVRGDELIVYPTIQSGETVRMHFNRLPGHLVRTATYTYNDGTESPEAVRVVSVNTSTGAITCTTGQVPSTITTSTPVTVVKGVPGFRLKIVTATPTAVTSSIVTLGGAAQIAAVAAAGLVAGDWVCLYGDSPVVQLPVEGHGVLAQAVTCKVKEALGDTEGLLNAKSDLKDEWENYRKTFESRVEEAPKKVFGGDAISDWILS